MGLYAEQQSQLMAQARKAKAAAPKRLQVDPELSKGEIRGLVLLVEFADNSFQPEYDQAFFSRKMNEQGKATTIMVPRVRVATTTSPSRMASSSPPSMSWALSN